MVEAVDTQGQILSLDSLDRTVKSVKFVKFVKSAKFFPDPSVRSDG